MTRFSGWRLQRVTLSSIYEYIIDVKRDESSIHIRHSLFPFFNALRLDLVAGGAQLAGSA